MKNFNPKLYVFVLLVTIGLLGCEKAEKQTDYYQLPTYSETNHIQAVIEIPAGTNHKIEYDQVSQKFLTDSVEGKKRIIDFLPYPGNYGFIPSTYSDPKLGGDGDALDVLVIAESVPTGTILEIIPIAMIEFLDNGESDNKIIAIPAEESKRIIKARNFDEFHNQYPEARKMISNWFQAYDVKDEVQLKRWTGETSAKEEIEKWKLK